LLALAGWRSGRDRWLWGGLLGALVLKIAIETATGSLLLASVEGDAVRPVPIAHLAGALWAVAVYLTVWIRGAPVAAER
jgi:hypothetical protein